MTIDIDAEASAGRISAEAFRNLELAEANGQASATMKIPARASRSDSSAAASAGPATPCSQQTQAR